MSQPSQNALDNLKKIAKEQHPVTDEKQTAQPPEPGKPAGDMLSKMATEDFSQIQRALKFVTQGYKLDNDAMQELLFTLKTKYDMSYRDLLAIYLTLDIAVEKGALTNDLIDYLKEHPEEIKAFEE
ncbi:hypothetical protein GF362_01620 [Candidatus Dojkabacteria bacterium]|nr:hypothetical protein [Candidatus Dojkabacteria bacterium]